jgi:hypothetical protein
MCHSASLTELSARFQAPLGADYDTEDDIRRHSEAIRKAVLVDGTMPPGFTLAPCDLERLEVYLDGLASAPCTPDCDGRACGSDGCGDSCGTCDDGEDCDPSGQCIDQCVPFCGTSLCGDDGCGGSCGECGAGFRCDVDGRCACVPDCSERACGDDGCGGSCGQCDASLLCNTREGICTDQCTPDCSGRQCGDDGCGGSCGGCPGGQSCDAAGQCICRPDCSGRQCGGDGCGGSCGQCALGQNCDAGACTGLVSFSQNVFPIFKNSGCDQGGACHGATRPADGLSLTTANVAYQGMVNVASAQCADRMLVLPGDDTTNSYLIAKILGRDMCLGSKMPKQGSLSNNEIQTIQAWIAEGALNN